MEENNYLGKGDTSTAGRSVANSILLKSYGAQSEYGPDIPLSAFVVIIKLFQIILNIACGITAGALPIMGYNYGARLYSRVKETFKLVVLSTLTVCVIATVLFESVPLVFVRMFGTDGGELYTTFAIGCLRIYLSLVIFTCLQKACAMFLQSIGHAKAAVPLSVLRDVLLIVLAILLPIMIGLCCHIGRKPCDRFIFQKNSDLHMKMIRRYDLGLPVKIIQLIPVIGFFIQREYFPQAAMQGEKFLRVAKHMIPDALIHRDDIDQYGPLQDAPPVIPEPNDDDRLSLPAQRSGKPVLPGTAIVAMEKMDVPGELIMSVRGPGVDLHRKLCVAKSS